MFEQILPDDAGLPLSHAEVPLSAETVKSWARGLTQLDRAVSDAERIDQLRALEELKAATCAAQAKISVDVAESQQAEREADGIKPTEAARGIGAQIALARRESPHLGNRLLGLAKALVHEMPHTLAALEAGALDEWRATILVSGTACLARADRVSVDRVVCRDLEAVAKLGNRRLEALVKTESYRHDPHSVVDRSRRAEADRRVSLRPAPDTMTYLTALLPVAQGVAAYQALTAAAGSAKAHGDQRGRGQIMADTLVTHLTGQTTAKAVPVLVNLVMTDQALLGTTRAGGRDEPARLQGFGPLPAAHARRLIKDSPQQARRVRRLFASPSTGQLVAMEAKSRRFPTALAELIEIRDQICRTPWCDAPVRHTDHIIEHSRGGPTTMVDGQGLCEACNYVKSLHGWQAKPRESARTHVVHITAPTGHKYESRAPDPPGAADIKTTAAAARYGFTRHATHEGVWSFTGVPAALEPV